MIHARTEAVGPGDENFRRLATCGLPMAPSRGNRSSYRPSTDTSLAELQASRIGLSPWYTGPL
jgi:hypothetical protein